LPLFLQDRDGEFFALQLLKCLGSKSTEQHKSVPFILPTAIFTRNVFQYGKGFLILFWVSSMCISLFSKWKY